MVILSRSVSVYCALFYQTLLGSAKWPKPIWASQSVGPFGRYQQASNNKRERWKLYPLVIWLPGWCSKSQTQFCHSHRTQLISSHRNIHMGTRPALGSFVKTSLLSVRHLSQAQCKCDGAPAARWSTFWSGWSLNSCGDQEMCPKNRTAFKGCWVADFSIFINPFLEVPALYF